MSIPEELRYSKEHEWVRQEDAGARIGITFFAQDQLGDVVYVELPKAGDSLKAMLDEYREHGIKRLVALRGDLPSGMARAGEFRFASELVTFIRNEYGDAFHIEVAAYPECHPQSRSAHEDMQNFRTKVEAGADSAITQYFFNADAYFHFRDECAKLGVDIPIVPGIGMWTPSFAHSSRKWK